MKHMCLGDASSVASVADLTAPLQFKLALSPVHACESPELQSINAVRR